MVTGVAASVAEQLVVAYDGREGIDLPWPAQWPLRAGKDRGGGCVHGGDG